MKPIKIKSLSKADVYINFSKFHVLVDMKILLKMDPMSQHVEVVVAD
jgi:hypothetical protein